VPNFSEGRDTAVVARIAQAIAQVPGAAVLGQTADCDHNRSVITFAGGKYTIQKTNNPPWTFASNCGAAAGLCNTTQYADAMLRSTFAKSD